MPNFNKEKFLSNTLDSVIAQTYNNWELIVIDDNSSDKSCDIIQQYVALDERIKTVKNNSGKKGASVCRNIGINLASGEYIIFLDSDDLLAPHCLEQRVSIIENNKQLQFAVFPVYIFDGDFNKKMQTWSPHNNQDHLRSFLRHNIPWTVMSPIWRTYFIRKIGGFNENLPWHEDVEFHTRVLLQTNLNYLIPNIKPDCYYLVLPERHNANKSALIDRMLEGTLNYLQTIFSTLIKEDKKKLIPDLRGMIFKFIKQLCIYKTKGLIDNKEANYFLESFLGSNIVNKLLSTWDFAFISFYRRGLDWKLDRLKGFNFIMYRLFFVIKVPFKRNSF